MFNSILNCNFTFFIFNFEFSFDPLLNLFPIPKRIFDANHPPNIDVCVIPESSIALFTTSSMELVVER